MLGLGNILTKGGAVLKFPNEYSFNFDGSNDYLDCGTSPLHTLSATTFTISCWIKIDNVSSDMNSSIGSLIADAPALDPTSGGFWLAYDDRNSTHSPVEGIAYNIKTSAGYQRGKSNNNVISSGVWHHIALVLDGQATLYIDGASSTNRTEDNSGTLSTQSNELTIGSDDTNTYNFNGLIDEVAIFDTALSADDVAKIASKPVDFSKASTYATDRTSNLKLWLRAGDKVLPENDTAIARQDFYTDFDGTDDYVQTADLTFTTALSVSAWVNHSSISGDQTYVADWDYPNNGRSFQFRWNDDTTDKLEFMVTGDGSTQKTNSANFTPDINRWYHLVATYNAGTTKIYINGVSQTVTADASQPTSLHSSSDVVLIGATGDTSTRVNYMNGGISSVSLYQTALDAQTISQMAKSRFTPMRDNRFSVVDFDGTTNNTIQTSAHDTLVDTTYTFWAKSDVTGANGGLFGHGGVTKSSFHFNYFSATGGARFFLGGNYYKKWDIDEQDDGQWHHYAIVADADSLTNLKLYVDGVEQTVASSESTGSPDAFTQSLTIGSDATNGNEWEGSIAQFAVYSDLKDDEFIYAQWSKGITADYSNDTNLTGYWRMGDDTSKAYPTIADSSSNSNDGTITNGASDDIVQQMVGGWDLGSFESSSEELQLLVTTGDWTLSGSWSYDSSTGYYTNTYVNATDTPIGNILASPATTVGRVYKLSYTVVSTTGSPTLKFPNNMLGLSSSNIPYTVGETNVHYGVDDGSSENIGIRSNTGVGTIVLKDIKFEEVLQSELSDTYPAIIDVNEPVLGGEEISEPSFASSTGWTLGTGWSISSNTLSSDGSQSAVSNASASITTGAGYYRVVITVDSISSGTIRPNLESWGSYISTTGTSTQFFTLTGNNNLTIQASADFVGSISLASVKEVFGNVGKMTNQDSADLVYSSVLPDQSFLTGVNSAYNFVSFDGTNDYIDCGEIDISSSEITLSAWVYRESTATDDALAGKWNSNGSMLYAPSGGTDVKFHINANVSTATLPTGAWTHVVGTLGDGFRKLYINGEVQDTDADTNSVVNPSGDFYIGRGLWSGGKEFLGNIGQVAYYNKMLTETEVNAIYTLGRHGNLLESYSDNLKGYWAMGALDAKTGLSDTTTTIYDRSGNSNHGTPVSIASSDLKSSPNAEPNGYAKGDTNRSTTTP